MWDLWNVSLWPNRLFEEFFLPQRQDAHDTPLKVQNPRFRNASTACWCIPLRSAIFLSALCTALLSLVPLLSHGLARGYLRVFVGGYSLLSQVIVNLFLTSGLVWGTIGVAGAVLMRPGYVRIFLYYQMLWLVAFLAIYFTDVPLLWSCELWRIDLQRATEQYGWNSVMQRIAMNSQCHQERVLFAVCSMCLLACLVHNAMATQHLLNKIQEEPRYLLRMSKDHPTGAFYARTLSPQDHAARQREGFGTMAAQAGLPRFAPGRQS